jgi:hypothetical protein
MQQQHLPLHPVLVHAQHPHVTTKDGVLFGTTVTPDSICTRTSEQVVVAMRRRPSMTHT